MSVQVILREPVDNLGSRGDVVKVANGYARNYLLPRKLALPVTESNRHRVSREPVGHPLRTNHFISYVQMQSRGRRG